MSDGFISKAMADRADAFLAKEREAMTTTDPADAAPAQGSRDKDVAELCRILINAFHFISPHHIEATANVIYGHGFRRLAASAPERDLPSEAELRERVAGALLSVTGGSQLSFTENRIVTAVVAALTGDHDGE